MRPAIIKSRANRGQFRASNGGQQVKRRPVLRLLLVRSLWETAAFRLAPRVSFSAIYSSRTSLPTSMKHTWRAHVTARRSLSSAILIYACRSTRSAVEIGSKSRSGTCFEASLDGFSMISTLSSTDFGL